MTETLLVLTHVGAGVTALLVAPVAMLTRKGGGAHRRWGRVYFWAMFVIFVTALAVLLFRPNVFLFIISILSFYGAFSGEKWTQETRQDPLVESATLSERGTDEKAEAEPFSRVQGEGGTRGSQRGKDAG